MSSDADLGTTIGAAYLGVVAASILFGTTNLQVYLYYQNYSNDWMFQKISVAVLWLLDVVHLSLTIHAVYHYVVDSFGRYEALTQVIWSFKLQIAINVVIIVSVQSLYALRVWKLGRHYHRILPWTVVVVVVIGSAIGIGPSRVAQATGSPGVLTTVTRYGISTFADLDNMRWVIYASFITATAIDVVIATAMCFYLQRSRSGFSDTNSKIVTLMQYVLISGFATSVCSLAALVTYASMPYNLVFLGIEFLLTKLYINSFLAMLNARQSIRDKDTTAASVSITKIMNVHAASAPQAGSGAVGGPFSLPTLTGEGKDTTRVTPLHYHSDADLEACAEGSQRHSTDASRSYLVRDGAVD